MTKQHKYLVLETIDYPLSNNKSSYLKRTFPGLLMATDYKKSLETVAMLEGNDNTRYTIYEISCNDTPKVDAE